jgi:vancomycin resistance protein YoaR
LWGTKTVEVESITGSRSRPTTPDTVRLPRGDQCVASSGAPGFTTSDTRIIRDAATGAEISRNTRTVRYDPVPIVRCE